MTGTDTINGAGGGEASVLAVARRLIGRLEDAFERKCDHDDAVDIAHEEIAAALAAPAAKGGTEAPKLNRRICPVCQGERGGMIGESGGSPDWDECWTCGGEGFLTENGAAHPVFDKARTTSDPYDERPGPWYDMKRVRQIEKETGIPFASPPPPARDDAEVR